MIDESENEDIDLEKYMKLVPFIIRNKMPWLLSFYDIEELVSEGYLALVKAKKTFKPSYDFKFTTYSAKCVFQYLMDLHRREAKNKGFHVYNYKRKKPIKEKVKDVEVDRLLWTLSPVKSFQLRKKYKIGM